ncbi:MAG: hypothetical protein NVS9B12_05160 [Vulcanimicrobiaceae bacterium]
MTSTFVLALLCSTAHTPAQMTPPPPPSLPPDVQAFAPSLERGGVHGSAVVNALDVKDAPVDVSLDLDAKGNAANVRIVRSSGAPALDEYVRSAVLRARYTPETRDCAPVSGHYTVHTKITKAQSTISMSVAIEGTTCSNDRPANMMTAGPPVALKFTSKGRPPSADVTVRVRVGSKGEVLSSAIVSSSGVQKYDEAALRSARAAEYAPAIFGCEPVAGDVTFVQHFGSGPVGH